MGPCPDGDRKWITQSFEGKELLFEADTLKFPRFLLNSLRLGKAARCVSCCSLIRWMIVAASWCFISSARERVESSMSFSFLSWPNLGRPKKRENNQGRFISSGSSDGGHDYHEDHSKAGWDEDEHGDHSFNEIFSIVFGSFSIIERYLAVGPDGVRLPSSYF